MGNIYNPVTLIGKVNFSERYTGLLEYPKQAPQVSREMTAREQSYIHLSVIPPFRTALHEDLLTTLTLHTPHSPKPCNAGRGLAVTHKHHTTARGQNSESVWNWLRAWNHSWGSWRHWAQLNSDHWRVKWYIHTLFTKEHQEAKKPWGSWKEK